LRELTINSRVGRGKEGNIKELGELHNKDPTTISRRIKKIRESIAPRDQLYYDRTVFDLTYHQLIRGDFSKNGDLTPTTLTSFVNSGEIPFDLKVWCDASSFVVYLTSPPSFASDFSEFFWEHSDNVSVNQLHLRTDRSHTYYFYHENYDFAIDGWKNTPEYIVDGPLRAID
jgi:hypothetical protein